MLEEGLRTAAWTSSLAAQREPMIIRPIEKRDSADWERMRQSLWPSPAGEHAAEIAAFFSDKRANPAEVLIARDEADRVVGFAELSTRPYAEGCHSGRVAYIEGWYVDPAVRRRGFGGALVRAAEEWGRSQGCSELGSDTEIENLGSEAAHRSLGFAETGRIICFRKPL